MSTLYKRHTKFNSKLDMTRDVCVTIDDVEVIIEFNHHSTKRGQERSVFDAAAVLMIQRAFDNILDLGNGERFIIIDTELHISIVGAIKGVGQDILVSVISAVNDIHPHNPRGTLEVVI